MSIVVIGKSGQLSLELARILDEDTVFLGRNEVDITDYEKLRNRLNDIEISTIINASAYTAVDKAETDEAACHAVNVVGVENLARYCSENHIFLVHVSTDYVFNGRKGSPYVVDDSIEPQGIYGKTKAQGEAKIQALIPDTSCIIRTAWVYSSHGNNFVKTMLRLMNDKEQLNVIDDQIGTPTWAKGLAEVCMASAKEQHSGIYHWTDEGVASWYDFALAIQEMGVQKGLISKRIPILPIPTVDYPTPAARPHYSVLDKTLTRSTFESLTFTHWREQLSSMLNELTTQ